MRKFILKFSKETKSVKVVVKVINDVTSNENVDSGDNENDNFNHAGQVSL